MPKSVVAPKIYSYLSDINNIRKYSQRIKICTKLFQYLTTNDDCIDILTNDVFFFNVVKKKIESELYNNIDNDVYNKMYNKIIDIGKGKNILLLDYSDNGNKINEVSI